MCARLCVCVSACVRACACARVRVRAVGVRVPARADSQTRPLEHMLWSVCVGGVCRRAWFVLLCCTERDREREAPPLGRRDEQID